MRLPRPGYLSFKSLHVTALGVVAVVAATMMLAAVFAVASLGVLQDRYQMSGVFADTGGIRSGDAVRVAGLNVGIVKGLHPDFSRGQVIVNWEVDDDVELGTSTFAEVALSTLLGGHYIRLTGPVEKPHLSDLPEKRRRIPIERTRTPATVLEVLGNATRAVEQLDVDNVNQLLHQLADVTSENPTQLGPLLQRLVVVADAVNQRQRQLDELVGNTRQVTGTLAAKDQALAQLVDQASTFLDEISSRRDQLATLLGSSNRVATELTALIHDHRTQIDAIIDDLHAAIGAANRQLPEINTSLAFIGPAFAGFASSGHQGPWIDALALQLPFESLGNFLRQVSGSEGGS